MWNSALTAVPVRWLLTAGLAWLCAGADGADLKPAGTKSPGLKKEDRQPVPQIAPASREAEQTLKRIQVAPGFKLDLWAAEPMLANPVAFCFDDRGRMFVTETHRLRSSTLDIRHYMFMLEDDLACRTVEDRVAMCKKFFKDKFNDLAIETEIVRLLEDRNGDGKADFSSVYADKFNSPLDGLASGVLARKGKLWVANIPDLWLLEGTDKDGHAVSRKSFSHGYGVRFSFTGHDLHGLIFGPDGKLYFSFGDRGANVKTKEGKTLAFPDEGAVFRCNPDGSEMEVVHRGLRNPQELAFDQYGNLFTGDNDFDHGDEERLVYVVEGGDSGWRVGYQHAPLGFDFVPWKAEEIWMAHASRQADYNGAPLPDRVPDTGRRPACYLPPISNIADGPSGFVFYPGTGFPEQYDNHFFLTHYKGSIANSKIQSFAVKPRGAMFELADSKAFVENITPTDVDFGPDGALYFSDWAEGWERSRKGRIYRVTDPALFNSAAVLATKILIGEGMEKRSLSELGPLLKHRDRRVRQEAQFEIAQIASVGFKGAFHKPAYDLLAGIAQKENNQLARIHAIWTLGQIGRNKRVDSPLKYYDAVLPLLADEDAEVRAQAARVLGDGRVVKAFDGLVKALQDASARVRFFAAMALGKLGNKEAVPAVLEMLRANNDQDPYLRHAGMMALAGIHDLKSLLAAAKDPSPAVRMAVLLAMRRLERPEIAQFLGDGDPRLVLEAARAINDVPIAQVQPQLAALLAAIPPASTGKVSRPGPAALYDPLLFRVINANFRLGSAPAAKALAAFAAASGANPAMQVEALQALSMWASPAPRDRLVGIYRPLPPRDGRVAGDALRPVLAGILRNAPAPVRVAATEAAVPLNLKLAGPVLLELVSTNAQPVEVRVAALKALAGLQDAALGKAVKLAQADANETLRKEAIRLLTRINRDDALGQLTAILEKGTVAEKQGALATLAALPGAVADTLLSQWLDRLLAGQVPAELHLDLLEAAARCSAPALKQKLKRYEDARPKNDDLAGYREALAGGDAAEGRKIFFERAEVSCQRCHKINGEGGDVGPVLSDIGKRQNREYILESIVYPNKKISTGFDNLLLALRNGTSVAGVLKSETGEELVINSPEDGLLKLNKSQIESRVTGLSAMPEGMGALLSKSDLRDLVEFLAGQKQ